MGLIHEPFLQTNLFLSPTYEDFTKIVAFMNFFFFNDQMCDYSDRLRWTFAIKY